MPEAPLPWSELRHEVEIPREGWVRVRAFPSAGAEPLWELEVDATVGRGELMTHCRPLEVVGSVALLRTHGEHHRGTSFHHHKLHAISAEGALLWSHPWEVAAPVVAVKKGLAVLVRRQYRVPEDGRLFELHLVEPHRGEVRDTRGVGLPGPWVRSLRQDAWPQVRATLERAGERWAVRITAWLSSANQHADHLVVLPWR